MAFLLSVGTAVLALASTAAGAAIDQRALSQYAPQAATCPSGSLVRAASAGLSSQESAYIKSRAPKAAANLKSWLSKIDSTYSNASKVPTIGLTHSGGGYRALLIAAGAVQAMDARDGSGPLAGLLQGVTYQAGLSGGSWFMASLFGNDYPTVSYLYEKLWKDGFAESALLADLFHLSADGNVLTDVLAKKLAGYSIGVVDPYGRLLGYQLLQGPDGGVANTLSGLASLKNFTSANVPFPIVVGVGLDTSKGQCTPAVNNTIYEFNPYEFGSWGPGVAAFTPSSSLGSNINNGKAVSCIKGFDSLSYVYGTSSDIFYGLTSSLSSCGPNTTVSSAPSNATDSELASVVSHLTGLLGEIADGAIDTGLYANYPNPFKGYAPASHVSSLSTLDLIDGGSAGQNVPIVPFIQPARSVGVLIMTDASADTSGNLPDGTAPYTTYLQSQPGQLNLPKMPEFPDPSTVLAKGLNQRVSAYGCNDNSKTTLVYMPNNNYTYAQAGESTYKLEYTPSESQAMIQNGNAVATFNGTQDWPACLACIIMKKTGEALPQGCSACYSKYCYN